MAKMTFSDVIAFAKSGWTPKDVKEFMNMDYQDADDAPEDPKDEPENPKDEPPSDAGNAENLEDESKKDKKPTEKTEDAIDYKKLYEEKQKELEALQIANTKKDISGNDKSDADKLTESFRRLM